MITNDIESNTDIAHTASSSDSMEIGFEVGFFLNSVGDTDIYHQSDGSLIKP